MLYLIYKITNFVNGKFYIGAHKTKNIDDGYMGSGKLIKKAIDKYGINNFSKEILLMCENEKDMFEKEKMLVEISKSSYNVKLGGNGGWDHVLSDPEYTSPFNDKDLQKKLSKRGIEKIKLLRNDVEFRKKWYNNISSSLKGKQNFLNKKHNEETKRNIGLKNSINQKNEKNSQFGTIWITNGKTNKKISKDNVIPEGWKKGRVLKKYGSRCSGNGPATSLEN